jgi:hypothetical protein
MSASGALPPPSSAAGHQSQGHSVPEDRSERSTGRPRPHPAAADPGAPASVTLDDGDRQQQIIRSWLHRLEEHGRHAALARRCAAQTPKRTRSPPMRTIAWTCPLLPPPGALDIDRCCCDRMDRLRARSAFAAGRWLCRRDDERSDNRRHCHRRRNERASLAAASPARWAIDRSVAPGVDSPCDALDPHRIAADSHRVPQRRAPTPRPGRARRRHLPDRRGGAGTAIPTM